MQLEIYNLDIALINEIDPENGFIELLSLVDVYPQTVNEAYNNLIKSCKKEFNLSKLKDLYKLVFKNKVKDYKEIQDFYKRTFNYDLDYIRTN